MYHQGKDVKTQSQGKDAKTRGIDAPSLMHKVCPETDDAYLTSAFSCEISKLGHILRSGLYPKQVIAFSSRLRLNHELETRTERVYHEVNRNPKVSTLGKRQKMVEEGYH